MAQSSTICPVNCNRLEEASTSLPIETLMQPAWKRYASFVGNSIWEVAVTALMIVLAPLAVVSLAIAFLGACFKMQWNDAGSLSDAQVRAAAAAPHRAARIPFYLGR